MRQLAGCLLLFVVPATLSAQVALNPAAGDPAADEAELMPEELTRGAVHEAYAQPVVFNPTAGDVVPQAPPEPIEELPPEEQPAGENVEWIPGYWSWDDDDNHFVWVSGLWRAVPPGLDWVPGYWTQVEGGYQWVSGFWRAEAEEEVEYLPPPPASQERGPGIDPPSADHVWVPGSWIWIDSRYAWRPGHWVVCRPGWIWVPARYVWTPYGFVFVDGYWDYALPRRGVLYAPIWFPRGYPVRQHYRYSPRVVLDVNVFSTHLFCRPTHSIYYFGDYYAAGYFQRGVYPTYAFHMSRYGYDPVYAYRRWEHVKTDPDWHEHVRADYRHRRDHEDARPPHTVRAVQDLLARNPGPTAQQLALTTSLTHLSARPDAGFRVEKVSQERRGQLQSDLRRWQEIERRRRETEVQLARDSGKTTRERTDGPPGADASDRPVRLTDPPKGRVVVPDVTGAAGTNPAVSGTAQRVRLFAEGQHGRVPGDRGPGDRGPVDRGPRDLDGPPIVGGQPAGGKAAGGQPAGGQSAGGVRGADRQRPTGDSDPPIRLNRPPRNLAADLAPPPKPETPRPDPKSRRETQPFPPRGPQRGTEAAANDPPTIPRSGTKGTPKKLDTPVELPQRNQPPRIPDAGGGSPRARDAGNAALEEIRKANQRRVEELQKQLQDRQRNPASGGGDGPPSRPATRDRGAGGGSTERGNLERGNLDRGRSEPRGGRGASEPRGGAGTGNPPTLQPRNGGSAPRGERDNPKPNRDRKDGKGDR